MANISILLLYVVSTVSAIYFSYRPGPGRYSLARRLYWITTSAIILFGTLAFIELRWNDAEGGALYGMALLIVTFGVLWAVVGLVAKSVCVVFGRGSRSARGLPVR
jgi:hypothetical protein